MVAKEAGLATLLAGGIPPVSGMDLSSNWSIRLTLAFVFAGFLATRVDWENGLGIGGILMYRIKF